MGKVKVKLCEVAGCTSGEDGGPFQTDEDCASVSERTAELKEHVYAVHKFQVDNKTAEAAKVTAEAAKVSAEASMLQAEAAKIVAEKNPVARGSSDQGEKKATMSRPTVEESISESDWSFFIAEW